MRFLIDEMFSAAVARHLRDLGHDARHVRDLGLAGRTDEVFAVATAQDRVVVTENAVDFVLLLDAESDGMVAWRLRAPRRNESRHLQLSPSERWKCTQPPRRGTCRRLGDSGHEQLVLAGA